MLKLNYNYPRNFTNSYDMLTCFELSAPRHHNIGRTGDKGNMENCGGHDGRDHTTTQKTAPSGKLLIKGLSGRTSYHIKCFNGEKWGNYENQ